MTNKSVHLVASVSFCAVLWLAGGCGSTIGSTESETHFLAKCQDQCGSGLECICGVCTRTCASVDPCRDLAEAASCELSASGTCASEPVSVCDVACSSNADCKGLGSEYVCVAGACRQLTNLAFPGTEGAGGSSSTNSSSTSDAGGTGSGGSAGETAVLPPRGNLLFQLSGCTSYTGGIGADPLVSSSAQRLSQLPALDGTNPGRRIEDGEEEASLDCMVGGYLPKYIQANLFGRQMHPDNAIIETVGIVIENGWIDESDGEGEAYISLHTGGVHYAPPLGSTCTLTLQSPEADNQFTLGPGRIYARFDCPDLEDPPIPGCSASGAFALERCDEQP